MDSWRLDEDWERAGHCCMLALLTSITLHLLEAPAAARTVEQEQDELQASSQAAALSPSSARAEGPLEGTQEKASSVCYHIAASSRMFP